MQNFSACVRRAERYNRAAESPQSATVARIEPGSRVMRSCASTARAAVGHGRDSQLRGRSDARPADPAVRDAARPHADAILSDAPDLLPQIPVTSTTATRGQKPDVQPAAGTTAANTGQVAVRLRAMVNQIPILDDEVREAMAQYVGELIQTPEAFRPKKQQQIYERELQRLIERELVLEEAKRRIDAINKPKIMEDLAKEAAKEADKQLLDIKNRIEAKSDDEFKAMLQAQGLSEGGMRRQFERNFMMIEYVRNIIFPIVNRIGLQQVRDYYEQHPDEFKTEDKVTWQDIFIDASRFQSPAAARQYAAPGAGRRPGRPGLPDPGEAVRSRRQPAPQRRRPRPETRRNRAGAGRADRLVAEGRARSGRWSISASGSTSSAWPNGNTPG